MHNEGPAFHSICIILKYSDDWTKTENVHDNTVISCIISCALPEKSGIYKNHGSSLKSPFDFCLELRVCGEGRLEGGKWENWWLFCFDLERWRQNYKR